jgi:hypothetical protein
MNAPIQFLSDNQSIRALANAFGIVAGIVIVWKGGGLAVRFVRDTLSENVRIAMMRFRNRRYRIYLRSASDIHYFLSRVTIVLTGMIIAATGFLLISITRILNSPSMLAERFKHQNLFDSFSEYRDFTGWLDAFSSTMIMLMFFISFWMTMDLSRNVGRIRRKWRRRGRLL